MESKIFEVEVSAKVEITENDKGVVFCEVIPPTQSSSLTLAACEIALQDYDDEATFEYLDTISGSHIFERK